MEETKKPYISLDKTVKFILANAVADRLCDKVGIFRYGEDYKCYYAVYGIKYADINEPIIFFVIESITQEIAEFHWASFNRNRKYRKIKEYWKNKDKFRIDIKFEQEKDKIAK